MPIIKLPQFQAYSIKSPEHHHHHQNNIKNIISTTSSTLSWNYSKIRAKWRNIGREWEREWGRGLENESEKFKRERKKETLGGGDHERKREKIKWSGFIICFQKFSLRIWPNAKLLFMREREREETWKNVVLIST